MMAHWKYLKYVLRHKWFVLLAGIQLRVPLWQLIVHDWTKFLPREWFPYVRYFYGSPKVGDAVEFIAIDGFGGTATITEERRTVREARFKIRVHAGEMGEGQEFWAHNFEIIRLVEAGEAFDVAWNHHQKRNPHHWQYWLLTNDNDDPQTRPLPMPTRFVREMVADWVGAGRAITGKIDVEGWYEKNREKIILADSTRRDVEALIAMVTP